jgi:hypothetical protein
LGDFNTYPDFEGPMDVLTDEKVWSKCQNVARDVLFGAKRRVLLYDAWTQCKDAKDGFTFSNMVGALRIKRLVKSATDKQFLLQ